MLKRCIAVSCALGLGLAAVSPAEEHAPAAEHAPPAAHAESAPAAPAPAAATPAKPSAAEILKQLADGNNRFRDAKALGPHRDLERLKLAADADEANHALATVLSCADSRVPVEVLFDVGIMDLFVVRVAGNVCDTDAAGSIEYGLAQVNTPVLVVLGHSGCGAVKTVATSAEGHGQPLAKNVASLVDNIAPAVQRAMRAHPDAHDAALLPFAVEENVWQSIRDLFKRSAAVRELAAQGKVTVVGAVYDLASGEVKWLDPAKSAELLAIAEKGPKRSMDTSAPGEKPAAAPGKAVPAEPALDDDHHAPAAPKAPAAPRPELPVSLQGAATDAHESEH